MGKLLTTFKDKTFEPSMKSFYQLYTDDTSTASQIYDSLLYVRGVNAGSLTKNQENDDATVSTVEMHDTYMPVRFYNVKSTSDGETPASATHTFFSVYNRAEYNGPDGENIYDLWADRNLAKLSGAGYVTNTIGGAYNYGLDAGSGDSQTIPGVYGAVNLASVVPTGDSRTVSYLIGSRDWASLNKADATVTYAYPTISEFAQVSGTVGTLAMLKLDLDYTAGDITNAYYIWADESSVPTPSGEAYFIKSNIPWPTLLSSSLTNTGAVTFGSTLSVSGTATLSSNVNIGGNLVVTGTSTFNGGTITMGDANTDNVVFGADVDSNIIPDDDDTYDLGSSSQQWKDIYIDGTAYVDTISMGGNIDLPDSSDSSIGRARFGDSQDLQIYHDGTDSSITNATGYLNIISDGDNAGHMYIQQKVDDGKIIFQNDNGSGGITTYLEIDGSQDTQYVKLRDSIMLALGNSWDFTLTHSSSQSIINNSEGDILIKNDSNGDSIRFDCEDGSNSTTEYFRLDGSAVRVKFSKDARFLDNAQVQLGNSGDLKMYHDDTDSYVTNATGDLVVQTTLDDGDIIFKSDNGSGGVEEYFKLDGGETTTVFTKPTTGLHQVVTARASNVALTAADAFKINNFSDADGAVITLPDSGDGSLIGTTFEFVITVTATSNAHKVVCTDTTNERIYGGIHMIDTDSADADIMYVAAAAQNYSAINCNGTTSGIIGSRFKVTNIAANVWFAEGNIHHTGSVAGPFATS